MSQSLPESDRQEEFLQKVQNYCQEEISSIANTLDQSPEALYKAVLGLGQHHWLALRLPCEWGGMGLSLEEKMLNSLDSSILYEEQLRWRSQAITLAGKCAHTAVAVSSGEANLLAHPAQRVYREALMFTISGQTTDVMEATLKELCNQG